MPNHTITIAVPDETYGVFEERAAQSRSSVEEMVLEAMRGALIEEAATDEDRRALLEALEQLDTAALWHLVARGAETEGVLVLAALNEKRQRAGLRDAEERLVDRLIREYDRAVLIRAKALALLHQRGEDVSTIIGSA